MDFRNRASVGSAYLFVALIVAIPCFPAHAEEPAKLAAAALIQTPAAAKIEAKAEGSEDGFIGPRFKKGLWVFKRTLDVVRNANKNVKYRLAQSEVTRCVDPTHAMKATFASAPVGTCVSEKPEKNGNKYTFGKRCDYLGVVSTVITVHDDDSYTELNDTFGDSPKTDLVVAKRIGDCSDEKPEVTIKATVSALQH